MKTLKRILRKIMMITVCILVIVTLSGLYIFNLPQFGKAPAGDRLKRIALSPNYKNGKFQNRSFTPTFTEGYSMASEVYKQLFEEKPRLKPIEILPSVKTDLLSIPIENDVLIWFGHSSYFIQIDGKRFLVDPVFSGNASPVFGFAKAFKGTDIFKVSDLPEIDFLLISHDHYDHLDYKTIMELKPKVKHIICGLGVGEHFEYWGYNPDKIIEKDWNETFVIQDHFKIHTVPARHGSGRTLISNNTLWLSYVIESPTQKIFVGGDSGYDNHFTEIGKKFGPFDLAILENGQYNNAWRNIHTPPEDVIRVAKDINAKKIFPVHSGKFVLARHPWDEPLKEISALSKDAGITLVTPLIGQTVDLNNSNQKFRNWWEDVN